MMNLGVRAHDLGRGLPEELAARVHSYGFTCIQLALQKAFSSYDSSTTKLTPGYGNYIRRVFQKRDIDIAVMGCYINPVHPDPVKREASLRRFEEHLRFARDFGCSIVATETGSCNADCSFNPETDREEVFLEFVSVIKRLARTAEAFGTMIGIEGVAPKHTINTHARMVRLLELVDSPNVTVVYDPANFIPAHRSEDHEEHIKEAFALFGDKITAVHVKDFKVTDGQKDTGLPAGKGRLNWSFLLKLLQREYPGIHLLLENNTPSTIDETVACVRALWEQGM